jgi:Meiotically up-regulated gene 113
MRSLILSEINRIAHENGGKTPGVALFATATGITEGKWRGVYWARWSDAVREAGLVPNERTQKLDNNLMLEQVALLAKSLGRMPGYSDIRLHKRTNPAIPTDKTLAGHYGSTAGLLLALTEYAAKTSDDILLGILPPVERKPLKPKQAAQDGFVYLLKSGAHYKIGRTDTIAKRVNEIRTTLPETVDLIHAIKSDDPVGIEAYWHRRFDARRLKGEWFALSALDVKAFLRRNFQ